MATWLVTHRSMADNPQRQKPWLDALSRHGIEWDELLRIDQPGWYHPIARDDLLLALGGDGTQSRVAAACLRRNARMGVLPAGTGNDFARALGIPLTPDGAAQNLARGWEQRVDVGRINGRSFLNVAHVGLGVDVGLKVPKEIKRRWGPLSYLVNLIRLAWRKRGFWGRIDADGRAIYGRWIEVAVANGPSFGGGHQIQGASHFNGTLTLVCIRARPLYKILYAWFMARIGRPLDRKVLRLERVQRCRLDTHRARRISADGELIGRTPMICEVAPSALRVILPADK